LVGCYMALGCLYVGEILRSKVLAVRRAPLLNQCLIGGSVFLDKALVCVPPSVSSRPSLIVCETATSLLAISKCEAYKHESGFVFLNENAYSNVCLEYSKV
jgi:hypothetical protein